ncbi:MAG: hypothetical protein ACRDD8_06365 [Bacteroidales bacterium]
MQIKNVSEFTSWMSDRGFDITNDIDGDRLLTSWNYISFRTLAEKYLREHNLKPSKMESGDILSASTGYVECNVAAQYTDENGDGWYDETYDIWHDVFRTLVIRAYYDEFIEDQEFMESENKVVSYDDSGSYISLELNEDGEEVDILDYFDENTYVSVGGVISVFAEIDGHIVYVDSEYKYTDKLYKKLLNNEFPTSSEHTDVFKVVHDSVTGFTSITCYSVDLDQYLR